MSRWKTASSLDWSRRFADTTQIQRRGLLAVGGSTSVSGRKDWSRPAQRGAIVARRTGPSEAEANLWS
jgi:hypothetical protein